jgi:asparagine synthase (glutamine-hydrolysing)
MSMLAGVWQWDGEPVASTVTARMTAASGLARTEGGTVSPRPEVMLQAWVRPFDRLSAAERQPFAGAAGTVVTWDGRLDNRGDLLLMLHGDLGEDVSDVALVAAAYARWGLDALPRLLGDWTVALWDGTAQRLVIARDYMGNRPLFYHELPRGLAWATQRQALVSAYGLAAQIDDLYVIGCLTFGVPRDRTVLRGLRTLRAGHVLVASPSQGITCRRYWNFTPRRLRYRQETEYADHLRHLLMEAVGVRLRADRRVWAHLSGGWDSSSVVCLAHRLVKRRQVEAPELQPISRVRQGAPESEERPHMEAVERWCGVKAVQCETPWLPTFADLRAQAYPVLFRRSNVEDSLNATIAAHGDHVVMSGDPGDLVMQRSSSRLALLEPLREGHFGEFMKLCSARAERFRRARLRVLSGLAFELLPDDMRTAWWRMKHWKGLEQSAEQFGVPQTLWQRAQSLREPKPSTIGFPRVKRSMVEGLYRYAEGAGNSDLETRISQTYPYAHRPLVEYALSVPQLALWHPGIYRAGMRRALADVLPPEILRRDNKGDLGVWFTRTQREQTAIFLGPGGVPLRAEDWQLVKRGYLEASAVTAALAAARVGRSDGAELRDRWIGLEAWLQRVDANASTAVDGVVDADARDRTWTTAPVATAELRAQL